jgi:hypothetical protein
MADNPENAFVDYHKVILPSCTGDGYVASMGKLENDPIGNYKMKGYALIYAMFDKLAQDY